MVYTIKDVAEKTGVSAYTLRYYEKEGILPPIDRDEGGRRRYSDENIAWVEIVTCLKKTQMPVSSIKEIVRLSIQGDSTINKRKELLTSHREKMKKQLKDLESSIQRIDKKIAFYDGAEKCD